MSIKVGGVTVIDDSRLLQNLTFPAGVGGLAPTAIKTSAYNIAVNDLVRVDSTAGAFTLNLPAAPADGDKVGVFDVANICGTNAVLIAANTKLVEGDGTGLSVNINGAYVYLIYNSTGTNWKLASTPVGVSGWSGTSGVSGATAVSGWSGTSGESGVSGWSGTSGVSGWSGTVGTSGWSGTSGIMGDTFISALIFGF